MSNIIVSPSILSCNFSNLDSELKKIKNSKAKWIHIDVMDGHFVDNITIGPCVIKSLRNKSDLFFDVHLMITDPEKYIKDFVEAGADLITVHYEATLVDTLKILKLIKSYNIKSGLSIKPNTEIKVIKEYLPYIDLLLIMTVEPGFSGQGFIFEAAEKIKIAKEMIGNKDIHIQVDGGINDKTAKICKNLGANVLVSGNYVFKSSDFNLAVESLIYS